MLRWRVLISVVLIPLLAGIFYADARGGPMAIGLFVLCCALALRSTWELVDLIRDRQPRLHVSLMMLSTMALMYAAWWPHLMHPEATANDTDLTVLAATTGIVWMVLAAAASRRYDAPGGHIERLGTEFLLVTYVGVLLGLTAQLRWVAGLQAGYLALGSLLICTKGGDIGAYFVGKLVGGVKLAPLLSPKKTVAGAVGGVLGALLFGLLWFHFATPWFVGQAAQSPLWARALYCIALGAVGIVGDLSESLIKRDSGKKDSAPLLPAFGGVLDILDSVLFAGPVAYLLWRCLPLATWLSS